MNYRFNIKNYRGRFFLTMAMDWGRLGGPSAEDYINIGDTAFVRLSPFVKFDFDFEPQAQDALRDFKSWLKERDARNAARRRADYEANNPFIQEYKKALQEQKTK